MSPCDDLDWLFPLTPEEEEAFRKLVEDDDGDPDWSKLDEEEEDPMNQPATLKSTGLVRLYDDPAGAEPCTGRLIQETRNALVFNGLDIMASLLAGAGGGLDGLYLEYKNGVAPGSVSVPNLDILAGVAYYTGLANDSDYLRVPLRVAEKPTPSDSRYQGNVIRFLGASGGATGEHGLPFSHLAGSVVYGAALARLGATPADDWIYARVYFTDLEVLGANRQVGLSWAVTLLHPEDK